MINLTPGATSKVKEIMTQQAPVPTGLRVAVVGGGCSGFSYHMAFEHQINGTDNVYEFDGLKVLVDQMSWDRQQPHDGAVQHRRLGAPQPGDPRGDPAADDEGEEGAPDVEDTGDEP